MIYVYIFLVNSLRFLYFRTIINIYIQENKFRTAKLIYFIKMSLRRIKLSFMTLLKFELGNIFLYLEHFEANTFSNCNFLLKISY